MELRHLRYFLAVAEELNFTRAAEKLFTVQPSLSQQIRDLEYEVGVQLLVRDNKRKVYLTPEGEEFLKYAKLALENAKTAISAARQVANNKNDQIYISFLNVAEIQFMPMIIENIKIEFPNYKINIQSLNDSEQINKLKNNEIDLSFTRFQFETEDFKSLKVMHENIVLVGSQYFLDYEKTIKSHDLNNLPIVLCDQNSSPVFFDKIDNFLNSHNIMPENIISASNLLQHINLINNGIGVGFIPEYATKYLNSNIKIFKNDLKIPSLPLYANYKSTNTNKALNFIINKLRNYSR